MNVHILPKNEVDANAFVSSYPDFRCCIRIRQRTKRDSGQPILGSFPCALNRRALE